jgi:DNA polymerase
MFHGAGTGRWSGKGVQVHNFPARDLIVRDFVDAADVIKSGDVDWCIAMYGDVMKLLSHALRGAIIPSDGREMMVADYSAIEARVVLWLADASGALDVFRSGGDIYCDMATGIYGYDVTKANKTERQFGKQSILGLGYGMGFVTFLLTCRKYGIVFSREDVVRIMGERELLKMEAWVRNYLWLDAREAKTESDKASRRQAVRVRRRLEEERELVDRVVHELALMKHTVNIYRGRYPEVKAMWKAQEEAAMGAVRSGGAERTVCGRVTWYVENGFLYCELPCGRRLSYRDPIVKEKMTSWGERRPHLSYMSVNGVTKKWERTGTYGGKVVENITQAVARDIMANAMLLADEGGVYDTVMSVHDELVCEVDADKGSVDDFERLMSSIPFWAAGCPVAAEAERMSRYKK